MKKIILNYFFYFTTVSCLVTNSCDNDKKTPEGKITNKEHMDVGTKTIENMQTACKG